MPTDIGRSRLRSRSAASSSGLSPRLPKEKEEKEAEAKSRELGRVSDIPMVNSTTVLCCYRKHAGVQGACCHEYPGESRGHEGIPAKGPGARIDSAGDKQTFLDVCTVGAKSPVPAHWKYSFASWSASIIVKQSGFLVDSTLFIGALMIYHVNPCLSLVTVCFEKKKHVMMKRS